MIRPFIWITILVQVIAICRAENTSNDEPLGRNYRKNYNGNYPVNSHTNNGKILSTTETKISSVSYKPNESNAKFSSFSDSSNLKTAASEEEKFSIGLGVLSPSYSQKFGEDGKTKLDFNSDKGGFSYSLTNVVHPHQPGATSSASLSQGTAALSTPSSSSASSSAPIATNTLNKVQSAGFIPSAYYNQPSSQPNPQVNIYHKQSSDQNQAIYGRLSSNNYPVPPNPTPSSPYSNVPLGPLDPTGTAAGQLGPQSYNPSPIAPQGPASSYPNSPNPFSSYNPYNAAIVPQQPFNPALSDAEKSFLQTVPSPSAHQLAGHHQHALPQPLPSPSQQSTQSVTQPKLVAQQQLTANLNPANIVHNGQYGPYNNPYNNNNPYAQAAAPNPYGQQVQPPFNPHALQGAYPGLLNMAASQQYPMADQMAGPNLGGMNYDYLNDPFMY